MKRIDLSGLRTLVMLLVLAACSTEHEEERIYFEISQSISNGFQSTDGKPQDSSISFNTGDIIGVFDPGIFSIGDTICAPGKKFAFEGIPTFAPEHFARVRHSVSCFHSLLRIKVRK